MSVTLKKDKIIIELSCDEPEEVLKNIQSSIIRILTIKQRDIYLPDEEGELLILLENTLLEPKQLKKAFKNELE